MSQFKEFEQIQVGDTHHRRTTTWDVTGVAVPLLTLALGLWVRAVRRVNADGVRLVSAVRSVKAERVRLASPSAW